MTLDRARTLLTAAASEETQLRRHLLVAAALREAFTETPVVVGGTAEEFWTADAYHPTDLDICVPIWPDDEKALEALGFQRAGRHRYHEVARVAVEFPADHFDGDPARLRHEPVEASEATILGLEDLYLDRVRQATMNPSREGVEFLGALAIAAARADVFDRPYCDGVISALESDDPVLGSSMRRIDQKVWRMLRARAGLARRGRRE